MLCEFASSVLNLCGNRVMKTICTFEAITIVFRLIKDKKLSWPPEDIDATLTHFFWSSNYGDYSGYFHFGSILCKNLEVVVPLWRPQWIRSLWSTLINQPQPPPSKSLKSFIPHSDTQFELHQVVLTTSTWLKMLNCHRAIGRLRCCWSTRHWNNVWSQSCECNK